MALCGGLSRQVNGPDLVQSVNSEMLMLPLTHTIYICFFSCPLQATCWGEGECVLDDG